MTQRLSAAQFQAKYGNGAKVDPASGAKPQIRLPKKRVPNKTEAEYMRITEIREDQRMVDVRFEPFTLRLPSGCRYTPDIVLFDKRNGAVLKVCEIKGAHIHSSRSIHAFKEARAAFPFWNFVFAQKTKDGWTTT